MLLKIIVPQVKTGSAENSRELGSGRYRRPLTVTGSVLAACAMLLSIIFINAYPYDTTAYHLPFTSKLFQIKDLSGITDLLPSRYDGFPKLWRIALFPGLALRAPRLFLLPNFISIGILCVACKKFLQMPWWLTCCAVLCFPISLEGFRSSYQDFSTNTLIAAGAIFIAFSKNDHTETNLFFKNFNIGLLLLALAGNIKTQGLLMAIAILFSYKLCSVFQGQWDQNSPTVKDSQQPSCAKRKTLVSSMTTYSLIAFIFFQPLANSFSHHNPFYPIKVFGLEGLEPRYSAPIQYIPNLPAAKDLLSFYSSALEIDPIIRSDQGWSFDRSLDAYNPVKKQFYRPGGPGLSDIRTGGSNGLLFLILSLIALCQFHKIMYLNGKIALDRPRAMLLTSAILVAFLPQSMELRYYLCSLFMTCFLALTSSNKFHSKLALTAVMLAMSFSIISVFQGKAILAEVANQELIGHRISNAINIDKAQLINEETCYQIGKLEPGPDGIERVLALNKTKVSSNIPFQCRMVIGKETFVDYTDTSNEEHVP